MVKLGPRLPPPTRRQLAKQEKELKRATQDEHGVNLAMVGEPREHLMYLLPQSKKARYKHPDSITFEQSKRKWEKNQKRSQARRMAKALKRDLARASQGSEQHGNGSLPDLLSAIDGRNSRSPTTRSKFLQDATFSLPSSPKESNDITLSSLDDSTISDSSIVSSGTNAQASISNSIREDQTCQSNDASNSFCEPEGLPVPFVKLQVKPEPGVWYKRASSSEPSRDSSAITKPPACAEIEVADRSIGVMSPERQASALPCEVASHVPARKPSISRESLPRASGMLENVNPVAPRMSLTTTNPASKPSISSEPPDCSSTRSSRGQSISEPVYQLSRTQPALEKNDALLDNLSRSKPSPVSSSKPDSARPFSSAPAHPANEILSASSASGILTPRLLPRRTSVADRKELSVGPFSTRPFKLESDGAATENGLESGTGKAVYVSPGSYPPPVKGIPLPCGKNKTTWEADTALRSSDTPRGLNMTHVDYPMASPGDTQPTPPFEAPRVGQVFPRSTAGNVETWERLSGPLSRIDNFSPNFSARIGSQKIADGPTQHPAFVDENHYAMNAGQTPHLYPSEAATSSTFKPPLLAPAAHIEDRKKMASVEPHSRTPGDLSLDNLEKCMPDADTSPTSLDHVPGYLDTRAREEASRRWPETPLYRSGIVPPTSTPVSRAPLVFTIEIPSPPWTRTPILPVYVPTATNGNREAKHSNGFVHALKWVFKKTFGYFWQRRGA